MKCLSILFLAFALAFLSPLVSLAAPSAQGPTPPGLPTGPGTPGKLPDSDWNATIQAESPADRTCKPGDVPTYGEMNPGGIKGTVVDGANPNIKIGGAKVTVPQLGLLATTCSDGMFFFGPKRFGESRNTRYVSIVVQAPGYGQHTMTNVGAVLGDTADATMLLSKGSKPTTLGGVKRMEDIPDYRKRVLMTIPQTRESTVAAALQSSQYNSQTVPPPYIYIGMRPLNGDGTANGNITRVDVVDFEYYVKHVLGQEWGPITEGESLKAGALAVRNFGWAYVNGVGMYSSDYGADCDNSASHCQVYIPDLAYSKMTYSNPQTDAVAAIGWYQSGKIFISQYVAGEPNNSRGCQTGTPAVDNNCMTQWGSQVLARSPNFYTYRQILDTYYKAAPNTYFTIPPKAPKTYVASASATSITLTFSSPGASTYVVEKWVNGAWQQVYSGSGTSFTNTGLVQNQVYYYSVAAQNAAGWSPWSFNGGYLSASARVATNPPAPDTEVSFLTDREIRLLITSTDVNVTKFEVFKWNGSAWYLAMTGAKPIDGSPMTYQDASLMPNTYYSYSVHVYDPSRGWSTWSNNNGSLTISTYPHY